MPATAYADDGRRYWINGRIVNPAEAALPLSDLAVSRGYAAFDALRTYRNIPFLLDEHLQRLETSCAELYLKLPLSRAALTEVIRSLLETSRDGDSLIRILVTGGDSTGFIPEDRERLVVLVDPMRTYPVAQHEQGIRLAASRLGRTLPAAKSTTYLAGVWETIRARRRGFDEVVFCSADGALLEGSTFNVTAVRGRELITPRENVLSGITLEHLLALAERAGYTITRQALLPALVAEASELFITSSTREVMPVVELETGWTGSPGPTTRQLHALLQKSIDVSCRHPRNPI